VNDHAINVRDDELEYPVLFLQQDCFTVRLAPPVSIASRGLLVDRRGYAWNVLAYDDRTQQIACDGPSVQLTAEQVRQKVVWLVSARGHFESSNGFGLPPALKYAETVEQIILMVKGMH
jgi:hypothetical protein